MKLFNIDSPFMNFLSRVADLIILNILWLLCCIPIVTIGASTTALYHVMRHWLNDEVTSVTKDFFQSFRADCKQSTLVYLLLLIPTVLVVINFLLLFNPDNELPVPGYLLVIWMVSAILLLLISSASYPIMAHFENTVMKTLRTCVVFAFAKLPRMILVCILNLSPVIFFFVAPDIFLRTGIFWIVFGGALIAYLNMRILRPVFKKLIPDENAETDASAIEEAH